MIKQRCLNPSSLLPPHRASISWNALDPLTTRSHSAPCNSSSAIHVTLPSASCFTHFQLSSYSFSQRSFSSYCFRLVFAANVPFGGTSVQSASGHGLL